MRLTEKAHTASRMPLLAFRFFAHYRLRYISWGFFSWGGGWGGGIGYFLQTIFMWCNIDSFSMMTNALKEWESAEWKSMWDGDKQEVQEVGGGGQGRETDT